MKMMMKQKIKIKTWNDKNAAKFTLNPYGTKLFIIIIHPTQFIANMSSILRDISFKAPQYTYILIFCT